MSSVCDNRNSLFLLLDLFCISSGKELWQEDQKHDLQCHIGDSQRVEVTKHNGRMEGDEKMHWHY